jgi:hypothetical protein
LPSNETPVETDHFVRYKSLLWPSSTTRRNGERCTATVPLTELLSTVASIQKHRPDDGGGKLLPDYTGQHPNVVKKFVMLIIQVRKAFVPSKLREQVYCFEGSECTTMLLCNTVRPTVGSCPCDVIISLPGTSVLETNTETSCEINPFWSDRQFLRMQSEEIHCNIILVSPLPRKVTSFIGIMCRYITQNDCSTGCCM